MQELKKPDRPTVGRILHIVVDYNPVGPGPLTHRHCLPAIVTHVQGDDVGVTVFASERDERSGRNQVFTALVFCDEFNAEGKGDSWHWPPACPFGPESRAAREGGGA
jgi:hypothetical protein